MKRFLLHFVMMIGLLGACTPTAETAEPQSIIVEQPTKVRVDLTPAQRIAISTLAKNWGLPADKIKLVSTASEEWTDACLGVVIKDIVCAQVITPGFRLILEANGMRMEYHTNHDGTVIRPITVALMWERSGGIAGFCDNLTIYLSGEVQGSACNNSTMVQKSLVDTLTTNEIVSLKDWLSQYGVVDVDASDPVGVADGMTLKLQLNGAGKEKAIPSTDQQEMMQLAQSLYQVLMSK